jgi:hypothetical protein
MTSHEVRSDQVVTIDGIALRVFVSILSNSGGPIQANGITGWGLTNCTLDDVAGFSYDAANAFFQAHQRANQSRTK